MTAKSTENTTCEFHYKQIPEQKLFMSTIEASNYLPLGSLTAWPQDTLSHPEIKNALQIIKNNDTDPTIPVFERLLAYKDDDFIRAFLSISQHILENPSIDTRYLIDIAKNIESSAESKRAETLKQFFIDVQSLTPSENRKQDQYQIYNKEINAFIANHKLLTQKEAYALLSDPKDKSASRYFKKLINEHQIFHVTHKSKGTDIAYPAFQFDEKTGNPKPIMQKIITTLNDTYQNWDLAFWLNSYDHDLEGSVIEAMDNIKNHNKIITLASNEARGDF